MTATANPTSGSTTTPSPRIRPFFTDHDFDFDLRCVLGQSAYGVGDPGTWLATAAAVTDGDRPSWFSAWTDRARQLEQMGDAARHDDPAGAGWAYLSASAAWSTALLAVYGLPGAQADAVTEPTFRSSRRCWDAVVDLSAGRHVRFDVPYEGTVLPGYLLRPDASSTRRPTLVITNGSDGSFTSLWPMASDAMARGWNAVVFDGPGQQSMLFEHGMPFRPDWEAVLTPVVDTLVARPDVDAGALTAYGISQGGYWLPRALAFEHRFVAAAADSGVVDVSRSWLAHLPAELVHMLDTGQKDAFNRIMATVGSDPDTARTFAFRARPYGITDVYDLFTAVRRYDLRDVAGDIRTPLLITDPEGEQFFPGQAAELAALLVAPHELVTFTAADGADLHCEPLAQRLLAARVFGWFTDRLGRAG
jgi:prolyl oligopeptidase family protein